MEWINPFNLPGPTNSRATWLISATAFLIGPIGILGLMGTRYIGVEYEEGRLETSGLTVHSLLDTELSLENFTG
jgi:hypothetical protein